MNPQAITILQLNQRLTDAISSTPGLRNVWVTGETSDMRLSGGHCYFELVEKDDRGNSAARIRANCWANVWRAVTAKFYAATGMQLASGMKIMVCVTAAYHPSYGMSVTVSDINPTYTLGDAVRRRNEILARLKKEGLMDLNRNLPYTLVPHRVAVVSARGAAGYGDFINQLYTNPYCLRFETTLFEAVMQGERTVPSVLDALQRIAAQSERYDCVVLIRGGGSTSDLAAFDSYELGAAVARFPLPVIVGIGHERDITVLDYVGNMRVKTPTAAAEWLIARGVRVLSAFTAAGNAVAAAASAAIESNRRQLAITAAQLPGMLQSQLLQASRRLDRSAMAVENLIPGFIRPQLARLDAMEQLIAALSPEATLRRGFSITTLEENGKALRSAENLAPGTRLVTRLADGTIHSVLCAEV